MLSIDGADVKGKEPCDAKTFIVKQTVYFLKCAPLRGNQAGRMPGLFAAVCKRFIENET